MRRHRYLLERGAAAALAEGESEGNGAKEDTERGPPCGLCCRSQRRRRRRRDWLYESYYCMSQQHPLLVFLLVIVIGACLALLAVFFLASGLVSGRAVAGRPFAPPPYSSSSLGALLEKGARAASKWRPHSRGESEGFRSPAPDSQRDKKQGQFPPPLPAAL